MKLHVKFMIAATLMTATLMEMSRCKAPVAKETAVTTTTDSVITVTDTMPTVAAPVKDTTAAITAPLTLVISNLTSATAPVIVGVYNAQNKFPDPKDQMKVYTFTPNGKELTAKIKDLKFGTYALAIYQDVNSNGKIDKNIIGIPTEPYAFSNNYKPTVKAPAFNNCRFDYDSMTNTVAMKMIK